MKIELNDIYLILNEMGFEKEYLCEDTLLKEELSMDSTEFVFLCLKIKQKWNIEISPFNLKKIKDIVLNCNTKLSQK
jgi:hypothetical protein